ncbi:hypothetical protein DMA11_19690 [Marinilabiliaceae bacterium JC017]|nr:hypothetical protein DMA11_19690 [Marinilabiliaceae bacterium JC017]
MKSRYLLLFLVVTAGIVLGGLIVQSGWFAGQAPQKQPVVTTTQGGRGTGQTCPMSRFLQVEDSQLDDFSAAEQQFRLHSDSILKELDHLRGCMLDELKQTSPSKDSLAHFAREIGLKHEQLKLSTIDYFLFIKEKATPAQQERLNQYFNNLLEKPEFGQHKRKHQGKGCRRRGRNR